jgi:hypothetical protein
VNLVSHWPTAAVVIKACKMRIPTVVLVRNPEDAVLSVVIQEGLPLTMEQQLRRYLAFYVPILPYHGNFLTVSFTDVVSDFGKVTRRINDRFATAFDEFEHTEDNVAKCFDTMEKYHNDVFRVKSVVEMHVNRPSEERKLVKEKLRPAFWSPQLESLRSRAMEVYGQFEAFAAH